MKLYEKVTVIMPCRDEMNYIAACLDSILANDYPKDLLEVLVIDGMSNDGTRAVIQRYCDKHSNIRMLDNPKQFVPSALNLAIREAKGDIIIRVDAHSHYDKDYIAKSVWALNTHKADNAGGIWIIVPRTDTLIGQSIVHVLHHPFGVGNAHYRLNPVKPKWVDTVFGGCYRRELFDRIGYFNEALRRGQDLEFNQRLKKAGGKILLDPEIVSHYYARSDLRSFIKHNWRNGMWAVLPFLYSRVIPVGWRHLVPFLFVSALLACSTAALVSPIGRWMLLALVGTYGTANILASMQVAMKERNPIFLLTMPAMFTAMHLSYGFGSLCGFIKMLASLPKRVLQRRAI